MNELDLIHRLARQADAQPVAETEMSSDMTARVLTSIRRMKQPSSTSAWAITAIAGCVIAAASSVFALREWSSFSNPLLSNPIVDLGTPNAAVELQ